MAHSNQGDSRGVYVPRDQLQGHGQGLGASQGAVQESEPGGNRDIIPAPG